jgi:hypothetical protein
MRAAADRFRPRGHWDRRLKQHNMYKFSSHLVANTALFHLQIKPNWNEHIDLLREIFAFDSESLMEQIQCVGKMRNFNEDSICLCRPRTTYQTKRRHIPEDLNPR